MKPSTVPAPLSMMPAAAPLPARAARTVLVCANPYSGYGRNRERVERLLGGLGERGLRGEVVWEPARRVGALRALAADAAAGGRPVVVAAGGDGSIRDVVDDMADAGLLDAGVPLATLPIGNENLVARHLGQGRRVGTLVDRIAGGATRRFDIGRITPLAPADASSAARRFLLMVGVGFDADVVHRVARWRHGGDPGAVHERPRLDQPPRRINWRHYVPRVMGSLARYAHPPVRVIADGVEVVGAHVFVFNLPEYGRDLPLLRDADPHDGKLDWLVFKNPGRLALAGYFAAVLANARHRRGRDVAFGRARSITIEPVDTFAAPLQADGDDAGFAPGRITLDPTPLWLVVK